MKSRVDRWWYGTRRPLWLLWPLAWLYRVVAERRKQRSLASLALNQSLRVPVIVVGNITAGGTGKSPLTAWLVDALQREGWHPVILTRGYGGRAEQYPLKVTDSTPANVAGDEPVMLATMTGCPVVVDPRRFRGAQWAVEQQLGDILVCDDGLQHYQLPRQLEIAVFDGERGIGNGAPIPVGPLREPVSRLAEVDFVVFNGAPATPLPVAQLNTYVMRLEPRVLRHLDSGETRELDWLEGKRVRAVAGIGNPSRFFNTLKALGAKVQGISFSDHHRFRQNDLDVEPGQILVMTAKDAVKCQGFAHERCWVLEVAATMPPSFREALLLAVKSLH
ncbi:MAG: tetraacyldisaccharide 4'-kinase [Marinobacter sp.]|uniref:tetraacyldisaccharide 4'-kinase n=1 Tax=Marinobacter sp. TaxID=50741 RepID=UPI0034A02AED